ncbi:hypothetical protein BDC45DRAFT_575243 [Circinella umbellata]|nr:hypothetical protein BDC45DRAFT_575243 [Circinella umbellata]
MSETSSQVGVTAAKKVTNEVMKKLVSESLSHVRICNRCRFRNGRNLLKKVQAEGDYVASRLAPLFERLLRGTVELDSMWYAQFILIIFLCRGESKMKSAQLIDKDVLDDGERRSAGTNVYGKITLSGTGMELCIIEISSTHK